MSKSKFKQAEKSIKAYFRKLDGKLLFKKDIRDIFLKERNSWALTNLSVQEFIDQLTRLQLQEIELFSPTYEKSYIRYRYTFQKYTPLQFPGSAAENTLKWVCNTI